MKKLFTIICCVSGITCFSQNITFDLSKKINITQTVEPQTITSITLINALAKTGTSYSISVVVKHTPMPFLAIPTGVGGAAAAGGSGGACAPLDLATTNLLTETDESKIPGLITALQKEIDTAPAACAADVPPATTAIAATTKTIVLPSQIVIKTGDEATIVISREKSTWTFVYKNERINHWSTYYGFTYIPDMLTKFPGYYANQQTGGTYMITKLNGSNKNVLQNISPTAMFTYRFFEKNPDAFLKFGITGGIMYNTDILGAMFGPSLVFGDNITINTGISFVQKYKLKGQYIQGQVIQTNLDYSQLHDKIWSYDMFFSIGFNLPELFAKKSSDTKTAAAK